MNPTTSWRTTTLAILSLVTILIAAGKVVLTTGAAGLDFGTLIPQVMAALGLIFARDQAASTAQHAADAQTTASAIAAVSK